MDPQNGASVAGQTVVVFGSGARAPHHVLSNFYEAEIELDGVTYPSAEHAFQATRVPQAARAALFGSRSPIGKLDANAFTHVGVRKPEKIRSSVQYWSRKSMVGILAKMKVKRLAAPAARTGAQVEDDFKRILLAKYRAHPDLRRALLRTGDAYLLEFDRGALRDGAAPSRWGGAVRDGAVVGHNQMGALLMWTRNELQREDTTPPQRQSSSSPPAPARA